MSTSYKMELRITFIESNIYCLFVRLIFLFASFNNVIKFMFQKSLIVGWTLAILCNCLILFGLTNKNISLGLSILYLALSRTGWALGIAWLVVACTTNNGGKSIFFMSLSIALMQFFVL